MIQKVGLLPRGNHRSVKAAYRVYTDHRVVRGERPCTKTDSPGALYRRIFGLSRPVVIEFLGAWDTVSSLGGIGLPRLPFAGGVQAVKFFRQALALDERRIRFTPEYRYLDQRESQLCNNVTEAQETLAKARRTGDAAQIAAAEIAFARAVKAREEEYPTHSWTFDNGRLKRRRIDCWFMGSHSDVGGGSDFNGDPSLSNIPFRWILREAVDCGILLSSTGVRYLKAVAMPSGPPGGDGHGEIREYPSDATLRRLERLDNIVSDQLVNPQSEQDRRQELEELRSKIPQSELRKLVYLVAQRDVCAGPPSIDAMRPPKVSLKNIWWLLEYLPLKTRRYSPELVTVERSSKWIINRGRPRQMVGEQHVHVSVLWRMRAPVSDTLPLYRPTARLCKGFESWEATLDCPDDDMWER
ncbi:hypothetical protein CC85DRAFT_287892 [Cutaneotrichosporon oleaginosum]|uniref:T6SS Phospholipase effector Tle1-like catalytic domain-containing protein n=1 Tax=Cutaneotrichosporon oleaginosum TaxID=879819 RepID=A0A0J0XG37_9TREE|nr:uncharacterized protein CC85DRAFT_287892 [Cutaneotrichosporon oleaginosum]KLT40011.1 hypothetical protein CC85DRAFT_287892 [Cutaneotrichosporon oleaginosum]